VKSTVASRLSLSTEILTLIVRPLSVGYSYSQSFRASITRRTLSSALSWTCPCRPARPRARNGRPSCAVPATPFSLAAIWAAGRRRSGAGCAQGRDGRSADRPVPCSRKRPWSTILKLSISTPSSSTLVARGVMEPGASRRHRRGGRARRPEQDLLAVIVEHRRDHGDVGQVGAAIVGGVQREDVAGLDLAPVELDDRFPPSGPSSPGAPACAARWRPGRRWVEHGAGEIQAAP
jgi:hypothetical protein